LASLIITGYLPLLFDRMILSALTTTEKALVLVDELGRGTSPQEGESVMAALSDGQLISDLEGVGIAHAIAEEIIRSKVCSTTLKAPFK
jgi:DNA mismatch repair ATPase MutS